MSIRKQKAHQPISFRKLLLIAVGGTACIFLICALLILRSGRRISEHYIQGVGEETLKYYQTTLDHTLDAIDEYCNASFADSSLASMFQTKDAIDRAILQNTIGQKLQSLTKIHDAYYAAIIPSDSSQGAAVVRSQSSSMDECDALSEALSQMLVEGLNSPGWQWLHLNTQNYLGNIRSFGDSYCAVLLSTQILSQLNDARGSLYLFCVDHGVFISDNAEIENALAAQHSGKQSVRLNGGQYLILTTPVQKGQFTVGMLLESSEATIRQELLRSGLILFLILLCVWALMLILVHQLSSFFSTVNDACIEIGSGNLDMQITRCGQLEEEERLYHTFNQMIQQIKGLRLNLYEQELSAQQSKTRFLQMQIKSHFFLNCLNTIHSLAMVKDTALIEEFVLCLSDYFRYLGSSFSDTVRFGSELVHLQNYIKLNQIRYPDRIICTYSIDPEIVDWPILPMLPQTFVENVFKHALGADNVLHMEIQAYTAWENGQQGMMLTIQDDGPGITAQLLAQLNDTDHHDLIPGSTGPGTGIQNSKARMWLHYGTDASVRFENAPEHGTIVRLFFAKNESPEESV